MNIKKNIFHYYHPLGVSQSVVSYVNLYTALSVFLFRVIFSDFLMNATFKVYVFFIFLYVFVLFMSF